MKLKKVVSILKSNRRMYLIDAGDFQWISDGYAAYMLDEDMPRLDLDSMKRVFDLTDKEEEKILFKHEFEVPEGLNLSDASECENELEDEFPRLCFGGSRMIAFSTCQGVKFIDASYLSPFADEYGLMKFYERTTPRGDVYIVIKIGMLINAVVMISNIVNQDYYEKMHRLLNLYKVELDKLPEKMQEQETEDEEMDGQTEM